MLPRNVSFYPSRDIDRIVLIDIIRCGSSKGVNDFPRKIQIADAVDGALKHKLSPTPEFSLKKILFFTKKILLGSGRKSSKKGNKEAKEESLIV